MKKIYVVRCEEYGDEWIDSKAYSSKEEAEKRLEYLLHNTVTPWYYDIMELNYYD